MPGPFEGINTNTIATPLRAPGTAIPKAVPEAPREEWTAADIAALLEKYDPRTVLGMATDARPPVRLTAEAAQLLARKQEEAMGGRPGAAAGATGLTDAALLALLGGGGGREFAPPTQGISLSEALAIQESERAKGNTVQIATHPSGIGYDIVSTSTPAPPPPARTGFATPEEAYAATPSGLALGQVTGTPTTGFTPTYVNEAPSPFQQQQFADKQAQDTINNEIQKSQMRLNAYISMGNQKAAAQEANYKSKLEIRAQALAERTAGLDPLLQMGRDTGYYPARAIMEMAGRALPEMPSPLNIEVPSSEAVLAAAGIPLAARPPGASPRASATLPPTSQMTREELAARLFRGMR